MMYGIYKIEQAEAKNVVFSPQFVKLMQTAENVSVWGDFSEICISGLADCKVETKMELGQQVHKVTLQYFTKHKPDKYSPKVFRITDTSENQYVIGTGETPHPTVTVTNTIPSKASERRGYTVKVEWTTAVGLISIFS